jgi:superfamily I DNA/RNA helicase
MIEAVPSAHARILDHPAGADLLLVTGAAASGKTAALAARYGALLARDGIDPAATIVAAAQPSAARALAARIAAALDPAPRAAFERAPFTGITLDELAYAIVADGALAGGLAPDIERLAPYEAEEIFERATAPLFSAEWADYLGAEIDPEISGLRAPDRFAAAVLRLIAKLRDAGIGPDEMLARSLHGAKTFYANPPNLHEPGLLMATKDEYRTALTVGAAELERQRRREIDLAKIVTKLYRSYLDQLVAHGCLGSGDALAEAVRLLGEQPVLAGDYRARLRLAVVDDVHDLRPGEVRLLQQLFGTALPGVTFAGRLEAATQTFAGARPEATFKLAATTIALPGDGAVPAPIAAAARAVLGDDGMLPIAAGDAVRVMRLADRTAETAFVADGVAARIAAGTPPERIAVVHRSARTLADFEDALLERGIAVVLHGDVDLLARPDVLDALAALWTAVDPFRHAWLLRVLQGPSVALSDATLALLCGEPANPQALLFPLPDGDDDTDRRWDRRRDLRLATNVVRGERDGDLPPAARERIVALRERRARWSAHVRAAGARAARAIVTDAGLFAPRPGETPARTQRRTALIDALLRLIDRHAARFPGGALEDALLTLERIAPAERGPQLDDDAPEAVFVGAIERIGPRRFEHVYVVDARAGSFPPYYVPDAFLFSPRWGMIPKDTAGEAAAARTAKFTWYSHLAKLRETYAREARRTLALALTRADVSVTVSAAGKATRGVGAPEFVTELQRRALA